LMSVSRRILAVSFVISNNVFKQVHGRAFSCPLVCYDKM
jgi:hypothetical protein